MQNDGAVLRLQKLEGLDQQRQVVSVERAKVAESELFEQHAWPDESLGGFFGLADDVTRRLAAVLLQQVSRAIMEARYCRIGDDLMEVLRDGSDVLVDRPGIVVQHDNHSSRLCGDVVQCFKRDAIGECSVSSQSDDVFLAAGHVPRHGHPQRRAEYRTGMACAVAVVLALGAQHKAVQSARLTDSMEELLAASQQLVHVGL